MNTLTLFSSLIFISVIFAADVKVSFDSYRNSMVATCDQKTIITTNPGASDYDGVDSNSVEIIVLVVLINVPWEGSLEFDQ